MPPDRSRTTNSQEMPEIDDGCVAFDFDLPGMPANPTADILDFDFCTATESLDALTDMLNTPAHQEDQMTLQKSYPPVNQPFSARHLSPFAKSRVEYSIELVKLAPKMMVEQCCTPWAHLLLYEDHMPRSLQDAHAACALYVTMNDNNAEHVARFITSRAEELIATSIPTTPIEVLARTQALMLYEIMLIFGGDIRLYARSDALIPHLEDVGVVLLPIAAEDPELPATLPLYPSTAARSAWQSYILRESARRTALVAFHITVIYTLLSGQMRSCAKELSLKNRVTLSAHLWKATSAFDFAMAWNSKSHFVIKELDFTDVLRGAQPDDLDTFANMMLIGLQGIDDIRGWYHTRGGALT
ncbi:uncharacterized protein J4E79_010010 [Alternaria viburni]|uniref:uncharacterized protein n=1 Tax=Alternaria viburni TaxID=566460 RepID=UPI0020C3EB31|nr:uncharacterized protein J4E79_010010 [Alternaria viburni]KAI4648388.1 hypothetical protein J4E79_010010 [Alternaria viburni]